MAGIVVREFSHSKKTYIVEVTIFGLFFQERMYILTANLLNVYRNFRIETLLTLKCGRSCVGPYLT